MLKVQYPENENAILTLNFSQLFILFHLAQIDSEIQKLSEKSWQNTNFRTNQKIPHWWPEQLLSWRNHQNNDDY